MTTLKTESSGIGPTARFSAIEALFWGSYSAIFAYSSVYLLDKGFSNSVIGYIIAIGSILSAVLQPSVGAYADRSRKNVLHTLLTVFSLIMVLCCGGLLCAGRVFWVTALLYGLLIAFLQVITPLINSLGMLFISRGVNINFGIARGLGSLAYAGISALLGVLTERFDVSTVIWTVMALYVLMIIAVVTFHFKDINEDPASTDVVEAPAKQNIFEFFASHRRFTVLLFGNVLIFISYNMVCDYLYQIIASIGCTSSDLGNVLFVGAALELPSLFLLTRINKRVSSGHLFKLTAVFMTLKNIILLFAGSLAAVYCAMLTQPLGFGLFAGISIYYVSHTIEPENDVRGQSLMTDTITVGAVLGSLLGGIIIDAASVKAMLVFAVIVSAVGMVIVCLSAENGKRLG